MDALSRKKLSVVTKYAIEHFSAGDWMMLGQLTGALEEVQTHPRLLRSLGFGDEDYAYCAADVLNTIFEASPSDVDEVIAHFDIDLWYEQKQPEKAARVFQTVSVGAPTFWKPDHLKVFVSHLAANRQKMGALKQAFADWGIAAFIAHDDIEPSKEWQAEIEAALASMDVLLAVIERGFRESAWTDQEVGYALGRGVDVVPLLIGQDPHGFIAKIQGVHIKGKRAARVAEEVALVLVRKPRYREQLLLGLAKALAAADSVTRIERIRSLDKLITERQQKDLLERSNLTDDDKKALADVTARVGAFQEVAVMRPEESDIPF